MLLRSPIAANAKLALCELIGLRPAGARILDRYLACRIYRRVYGRYPDPTHPALFSDKTSARKLFDRRDIFPLLADKLMMRDFVARKLGELHLPTLHATCGIRPFDPPEYDPIFGEDWRLVLTGPSP